MVNFKQGKATLVKKLTSVRPDPGGRGAEVYWVALGAVATTGVV